MTTAPSTLWQTAASMAARLHLHQFRKDGITPYHAHPFRVALTIQLVFNITDEATIAAALLHDVIEDTPADYDDIVQACNKEVADIVASLTKDMRLPEAQREIAYDQQLANANWQTHLIKLADVYDNLCDSHSGSIRRKAHEKAQRAIEIAQHDHPHIQHAIEQLRILAANTPPE